MTDLTLQRIWDSREAISRRFTFDSHKLIQYYQSRQKMAGQVTINHQQTNNSTKTKGFVENP